MRIITHYGSQWEEARNILMKHWHLLTRSPQLAKIVGPRPHLVAKGAKNLSDELVRSDFTGTTPRNWLTDLPELKGMLPCGKCHICKLVDRTDTFNDADIQKTSKINQFIKLQHLTSPEHAGMPLPQILHRQDEMPPQSPYR